MRRTAHTEPHAKKKLDAELAGDKKCPPLPIFRAAPVLFGTSSHAHVARARRAVVAARMRARESFQKSCRADKHGENPARVIGRV